MAEPENGIPRISRESIYNGVHLENINIRKSEKEYKKELEWELQAMAAVIKEMDKSGIDNLKQVLTSSCEIIEVSYEALKDGVDLGDISAAYKVVVKVIDMAKVFDKAVGEAKDLDPDEIGALSEIFLRKLLAIFVPGVETENPKIDNLNIVLANAEQLFATAKKALADGLQWSDIEFVIPIAVSAVKIAAAITDAVNEAKQLSIKQVVEMIIKLVMTIINVIKA